MGWRSGAARPFRAACQPWATPVVPSACDSWALLPLSSQALDPRASFSPGRFRQPEAWSPSCSPVPCQGHGGWRAAGPWGRLLVLSPSGWPPQGRRGREVLVFFLGTGVVGRLCRGPTWAAGDPAGWGWHSVKGVVPLEGYSPALGGGGARSPARWEACLPGTRPHLVIAEESQMLYRSSHDGRAGAGCCRVAWGLPSPQPGLGGGAVQRLSTPPVGLASLWAPACLVALYPPLCSPHLLTCWSSAQPK